MKGIFITGTNTGVGKTWVGSQLVKHLYLKGINVVPQKPIESGCTIKDQKLFAEDAYAYYQACKGSTKMAQITPFRFSQVCSPARASVLSNMPLKLVDVVEHIKKSASKGSTVVVEGAGGIYSPLTTDALNIDLAKKINLPVLLVAEDALGTINAILLSLKAIESAGLKCIAIVLNETAEREKGDIDNYHELKQYTNLPIIKNHFKDNDAISKIASLL